MVTEKAIRNNHTPGRATDYGTNLILQLVLINAHVRDIVYCLWWSLQAIAINGRTKCW